MCQSLFFRVHQFDTFQTSVERDCILTETIVGTHRSRSILLPLKRRARCGTLAIYSLLLLESYSLLFFFWLFEFLIISFYLSLILGAFTKCWKGLLASSCMPLRPSVSVCPHGTTVLPRRNEINIHSPCATLQRAQGQFYLSLLSLCYSLLVQDNERDKQVLNEKRIQSIAWYTLQFALPW
jgi:hypothetical protein